jgi:hypothetical protein
MQPIRVAPTSAQADEWALVLGDAVATAVLGGTYLGERVHLSLLIVAARQD